MIESDSTDPQASDATASLAPERPAIDASAAPDELDDQLDAARPESGLQHEHMAARLKEKLFGAPAAPVRIGRFVILDRLGEGGMGTVYSAYDPELDRRVALKILRAGRSHASHSARERLWREGQALARLSHPNVVPVYELGIIDDQIFIVMEFVVGRTLREWASEPERTWREVLSGYQQAGQGLAAAHAQGLVHRDFKPDNVQVGNDRRIRVLDFGLARDRSVANPGQSSPGLLDSSERISTTSTTMPMVSDGGDPTPQPLSNKRLITPLTATGALLGTPAYMSPEQFAGSAVGPESDQFSFCLSLYEGLYKQRPFVGDTVGELRRNMKQAEVLAPPRASRVPGWIHPILCRGLAYAASDRYPSMAALLADLGRDPARAHRRWLIAAVMIGLVGLSTYSLIKAGSAAAQVCEGAERELAGVWDAPRRAAVHTALMGTGRAYAEPAWTRVAEGLDAYARSWAAMHRDACMAHRRGEQSDVLLDKRMVCIDARRVALSNTVSVLAETDAESLGNTVDVVQKLPSIAYCGNAEALAAEVPPPEDPAVARRIGELDGRLARAKALEDAGRYSAARALVDGLISEAGPLGYRPFMARALLARGRIAIGMEERERAVEPLHRATVLALATRMNEVGLEALARAIFARGTTGKSPAEALGSLDIAEALVETVPQATFVHALLLNNAGVVFMANGDRQTARRYFERAAEVKAQAPDEHHVELVGVQHNLALVTPEPRARAALLGSAARESERILGDVHPRSLEMQVAQSLYEPDPTQARAILEATCEKYERYHPGLAMLLADCSYYLGFLQAELGDRQDAAARLVRVAAAMPAGGPNPWHRELIRGYGLLYAGDAEAARAALAAALAQLDDGSERWWLDKRKAEVRLAQGMSELALGRPSDAIAALDEAIPAFTRYLEMNQKAETWQRMARARITLATALWKAQQGEANPPARDALRARALEQLAEAERFYGSAGAGYEHHVQELAQWRSERGVVRQSPDR